MTIRAIRSEELRGVSVEIDWSHDHAEFGQDVSHRARQVGSRHIAVVMPLVVPALLNIAEPSADLGEFLAQIQLLPVRLLWKRIARNGGGFSFPLRRRRPGSPLPFPPCGLLGIGAPFVPASSRVPGPPSTGITSA
jgi:hypothetical protein